MLYIVASSASGKTTLIDTYESLDHKLIDIDEVMRRLSEKLAKDGLKITVLDIIYAIYADKMFQSGLESTPHTTSVFMDAYIRENVIALVREELDAGNSILDFSFNLFTTDEWKDLIADYDLEVYVVVHSDVESQLKRQSERDVIEGKEPWTTELFDVRRKVNVTDKTNTLSTFKELSIPDHHLIVLGEDDYLSQNSQITSALSEVK